MELWIRSQDKTRLGKIELIEYQEDDYGFYLFGWKDKFEGTRLATYKSKERALEVLDEIQDKILNGAFATIQNGLGETKDFIPNPIFIYEMPSE